MHKALTKIDSFVPTNRVDSDVNAPLQPKQLQREDFTVLSKKDGFASVSEEKIRQNLDLKPREGDDAMTKIDRLHEITNAMKSADTQGSFSRFFSSVWTKIKDSAAGRFWTRNIIPKFTTPTINDVGLVLGVGSQNKTKLELTLKGTVTEATGEDASISTDFDAEDSKIVLEWARMRGVTLTERFKAVFGRPLRSGPEEIAAKVQEDMIRQTRLRSCGVGYRAEQKFQKENQGFLKLLESPKSISLKDFTVEELNSLRGDLRPDEQKKMQNLIDARSQITDQTTSKQLKSINTREAIGNLKSLVLQAHLSRLESVNAVCGTQAFTESQRNALAALRARLNGDAKTLNSGILESARDLQEMSTMLDAALRLGRSMSDEPYQTNLAILRQGKEARILPNSVITAPWFFSPEAAKEQAQNLDTLATSENQQDLQKLIADSSKDNEIQILGIQGEKSSKEEITDLAISYRSLADNQKAMYRFQGIMFALAGNNADRIKTSLISKTHDDMQRTTGLKDTGNQVGKQILGAALAVGGAVQTYRGNWKSAAFLGILGGGMVAAGGPDKNTKKVRQRTAMIVDAIMSGMATGSLEHIVKANQALADVKADEATQKWVKEQIGSLEEGGGSGILGESLQIKQNEEVADISEDFKKYLQASSQERARTGSLDELLLNEINKKITGLENVQRACESRARKLGDAEAPIALSGDDIVVHDELTLQGGDILVDPKVANELRQGNKENMDAAESVQKSLGVLKRTFAQGSDVREFLTNIESDLRLLIDADPAKLDNAKIQEISNKIETLRSGIDKIAGDLTASHAGLIHEVINSVDENAGRLVELKVAMNRLAKGFSDASLTEEQYQADLQLLNDAVNNSDTANGKQNFALFSEKDTAAKIRARVEPFMKEVEAAKKEWDNFQNAKSALAQIADTSFNGVLDKVDAQKKLMLTASEGLQKFAATYALSAGVEGKNYAEMANQEVDKALQSNAARILNVEQNPETQSGLALFAGPFAGQDPIWTKTWAHLDASAANKTEVFKQLCQSLPEFNIRDAHSESKSEKIAAWKNGISIEQGIRFVTTLVPDCRKKQSALSDAVNIAAALDPVGDARSLQRQIHLDHIETQLETARQNETIKFIYRAENEELDVTRIIENHAMLKEELEKVGLPSFDFDAKSLCEKYRDDKSSLTIQDLGHLSQLSESVATLKGDIAATKKARLESEMWTFLTKIKHDLRDLDASEGLLSSLQVAQFDFKPIENFDAYQSLNQTITDQQKSLADVKSSLVKTDNCLMVLKDGRDNTKGLRQLNISDSALDQIGIDSEITKNAKQFAVAMTSWQNGLFRKTLLDYQDASNNQQKYLTQKDFNNSKIQSKSQGKQLDHQLLKYLDPETLRHNRTLLAQDEVIQIEDELIGNNYQGHRAAFSVRFDGQIISRDNRMEDFSPEAKKFFGTLPFEKRPYHEKTLFDTVGRLAESNENLERGNLLDQFIQNVDLKKQQTSTISKITEILNKADVDRSNLLQGFDNDQVTNALRAAIVKSCLIERSITPADFNDQQVNQVKEALKKWGWNEKNFPADSLIWKALEEVKNSGEIPKVWIQEAEAFQHKSKVILEAVLKIQETMINSLLGIDKELKKNSNISENQKKTSELYQSNLLESSFISEHARLNPSDKSSATSRTPYQAAETALNEVFKKYQRYYEGSRDKLAAKREEILGQLKSLEKNGKPWPEFSKIVSEAIDGTDGSRSLFDIAYNRQGDKNRNINHETLTSIAKMDFESEAAKVLLRDAELLKNLYNDDFKRVRDVAGKVSNIKVGDLFPALCEDGDSTFIKDLAKFEVNSAQTALSQLKEQPADEFFAGFQEGGRFINFLKVNSDKDYKELQAAMLEFGAIQKELSEALQNPDFGKASGKQVSDLQDRTQKITDKLVFKNQIFGNSPLTSLVKRLNDNLTTAKKQLTDITGELVKNLPFSENAFRELRDSFINSYEQLTIEPNPYKKAQLTATIAQIDEVKAEENPVSIEAEIEMIIEEDQPEVPLQNPSIPSPPIDPRIQQQLEAINLAAQQPPPQANPIQQNIAFAKPQTYANVSFQVFGQDNPRPKINNEDWFKASNKPHELADYVHIPSQADGFCLLTCLAASRNQTTKQLIAELDRVADGLGNAELIKWNSEKTKAQKGDGIDTTNISNLLAKAGLGFKQVQLTENPNTPAFFETFEIPVNAKLSADSPVLLFREKHFDLLLPRSEAQKHNLSFDGSKYIANS